MTHLGADVAAFVDGQLPPARELAARRHLEQCERCRSVVAEQEQLKRRMARTAPAGGPAGVPAHLAAALAAVASDPREPDSPRRQALRRSVGVVVALVGSSAAVLLLQVSAHDLPTLGLAAYEVVSRHPHVVHENGVLVKSWQEVHLFYVQSIGRNGDYEIPQIPVARCIWAPTDT